MNRIVVILCLSLSFINAQSQFWNIIETGLSRILSDKTLEVAQTDVKFYMYNNENTKVPITLVTDSVIVKNITNVTTPFKLIIHGYTDNANLSWVMNMKNEYLKKGSYNIIAVDWSDPALNVYPISVSLTKPVGIYIAKLIIYLNKIFNIPYENIHLIGHSLGAHVAGFAGKHLITTEGQKFGRITGMDPAGVLFVGKTENERISKEDANFVDIIHTDGHKNGYFDPLGHVDFYPNEGIGIQPGCLKQINVVDLVACSHLRSYIYFTESINSNKFIAKQCGSYSDYMNGLCLNNSEAIMGENLDSNARGLYYLNTNEEPPYARHGNI